MSESLLSIDDESVLNDEPTGVPCESIEPLDDERIAELLGDQSFEGKNKSEEKENGRCSTSENSNELPTTTTTVTPNTFDQKEEKDEAVSSTSFAPVHAGAGDESLADDIVVLDSDEEIIEEIIHPANSVSEDVAEEPNSSVKRKRSNTVTTTSPHRSPARKRASRRVGTWFPARRAAIGMITKLMGQFDRTLHFKDLKVLTMMVAAERKRVEMTMTDKMTSLKQENQQLRDQLLHEKRAHRTTLANLEKLDKTVLQIRKQMTKFKSLLTIPCTPEANETLFGRTMHQMSHEQIMECEGSPEVFTSVRRVPQPHPTQFSVPYHPQNQRKELARAAAAAQYRAAHGYPNHQLVQQDMSGVVAGPSVKAVLQHMHQTNQIPPQPQQRIPQLWPSLPTPTATNLGHNFASPNIFPKMLIDKSDPGRISLAIPLIPFAHVIPIEEFSNRLPPPPKIFETTRPNPLITVSINSSAADFRENWQIGGKIHYDGVQGLNKKVVQVFVQVSSLKTSGLNGRISVNCRETCGWGVSDLWPCLNKAHRFRIVFHRHQQLPVNDRISLMVMVKDRAGPYLDISRITYLDLV